MGSFLDPFFLDRFSLYNSGIALSMTILKPLQINQNNQISLTMVTMIDFGLSLYLTRYVYYNRVMCVRLYGLIQTHMHAHMSTLPLKLMPTIEASIC